MAQGETERRYSPIIILTLVAALVAVLGLWAADKAGNQNSGGSAGEVVATSNEQFEWKLVTTWPKNFPGLGSAAENLATMVDEMSNGRLKIRVYGGGEIVPALGVFDAVSQGVADAGTRRGILLEGQGPIIGVFYRGTLWFECPGDVRLVALWWRPRAVGGGLCTLQPGAHGRWQYWCANGGVV